MRMTFFTFLHIVNFRPTTLSVRNSLRTASAAYLEGRAEEWMFKEFASYSNACETEAPFFF